MKKPTATGSAGRCEPGVGRFTDPHPLTCSFFTPPFCSAMFGLCGQPLQPAWACFSFSAFLLPARPLACVDGLVFSHPGLPPPLDLSTTGSHGSNRAGLLLRWRRSPTRPPKPHTGPHKAESGFTAFFPSLSWWKPSKQQICVQGDLPGAQFQDENLIGKKRFSLPWLSLASPPHFFSRPPSRFSNSVLRSLFFVYSTAIFEVAYP